MRHTPARVSLLLCLAVASPSALADNRSPVAIPALRAAEAQDAAIVAIDGQIERGEWEGARAAAAEVLERSKSVFHGALQRALVRLALLEAKLGQDEEALWHWQALQALGGGELAIPLFPKFGAAGERLESRKQRSHGEIPAGVERWGASGLTPARRIGGDLPQGDAGCTASRGPLWARFEAVIDAAGKLQQPTISGTSVCFSFEVLKAARSWTFEPARRDGAPVAALYAETINPTAGRTLRELIKGAPVSPKILSLLEASKFAAAEAKLAKEWEATLNDGSPSRRLTVTLLALRALALAAHDDPNDQRRAGCLFEAAQGEEPAFYHLDLSPFGAAGQRLAAHHYGEVRAQPIAAASAGERSERPEVLRETWQRPRKRFPSGSYGASHVYIEALIDASGAVREPILFGREEGLRGLDLEALDAFCASRFRPATIAGRPVAALYVLTLSVGSGADTKPPS